MTTSPRLELAPGRSRLALGLWLAAVLGVGAGLWLLNLQSGLRALLLLALLASGRDLLWPRSAPETLVWDGLAWSLLRSGVEAIALGDCRPEFVSRWLVVLGFREARRRRYRPVFADAVTPEVFRSLLVMARREGSAPT